MNLSICLLLFLFLVAITEEKPHEIQGERGWLCTLVRVFLGSTIDVEISRILQYAVHFSLSLIYIHTFNLSTTLLLAFRKIQM